MEKFILAAINIVMLVFIVVCGGFAIFHLRNLKDEKLWRRADIGVVIILNTIFYIIAAFNIYVLFFYS